jgi:hypothetical protein
MKNIILVITICLTLSGCASQIMQSYVGQPVQNVMLDYGPPQNAIDMPDKTRVFQWVMNSSYTTPVQVNTHGTGSAYGYGNHASVWMTSNSTITGGQTINSQCVYSLFTRWDENTKSYYVTGFKKPDIMCE